MSTTESDLDLFSTTDAMTWAGRFVQRVRENPSIATDAGTMVAWFACAIGVGQDSISIERATLIAERDSARSQVMRLEQEIAEIEQIASHAWGNYCYDDEQDLTIAAKTLREIVRVCQRLEANRD